MSQVGEWNARSYSFVAQIARMIPDGECKVHQEQCSSPDCEGDLYVTENDDAVETVNSLIHKARELMADRPW